MEPLLKRGRYLKPGEHYVDEDLGLAGYLWSDGPDPRTFWFVQDTGKVVLVECTLGLPVPWQVR